MIAMLLAACNIQPAPAPTMTSTPAPTDVPRFEKTDCWFQGTARP